MDGCQTQRQAGQGDEHGSESLAALVQRGNEEEKDDRMGSGWMWNGNQNEKTHGMNDFCLRVVLTGCLWKKNISNCMLQVCFCSGHALPSRGPGEYFAFFPTFDLVTLSPSLSLSLVLCHWLRASKICGPKVWKGHVNHVVSGLMNVQRPIGLCQDPPRSVYLLCTIFAAYNRWTRKHNPWRLQCSCPRQDEFAACEERVEGQFRDQINALQSQVWGPCNGGLSQDEGGVGS